MLLLVFLCLCMMHFFGFPPGIWFPAVNSSLFIRFLTLFRGLSRDAVRMAPHPLRRKILPPIVSKVGSVYLGYVTRPQLTIKADTITFFLPLVVVAFLAFICGVVFLLPHAYTWFES